VELNLIQTMYSGFPTKILSPEGEKGKCAEVEKNYRRINAYPLQGHFPSKTIQSEDICLYRPERQ
jgi:hypothetical protein